MRRTRTATVCFVGLFVGIGTLAIAQNQDPQESTDKLIPNYSPEFRDYEEDLEFSALAETWKAEHEKEQQRLWSWIQEGWKTKDPELERLKEQIGSEIKKSESSNEIQEIESKYKTELEKRSDDPKALFAYAVANRTAAAVDSKHDYFDINLMRRFEAMPMQDSYEYYRLRFLTQAQLSFRPELLPAAKKLLDANAEDSAVLFATVSLLDPKDVTQRQHALQHLAKLRQLHPTDAGVDWLEANYQHSIYTITKDQKVKTLALQNYRRFLNKAQPDHPARSDAQTYIQELGA